MSSEVSQLVPKGRYKTATWVFTNPRAYVNTYMNNYFLFLGYLLLSRDLDRRIARPVPWSLRSQRHQLPFLPDVCPACCHQRASYRATLALLEFSSGLSDDSCPGHQSHRLVSDCLSNEENAHPPSAVSKRGPCALRGREAGLLTRLSPMFEPPSPSDQS